MGPAAELFLLLLLSLALVASAALLLTRSLWSRAWNKIVDTDRCEREALEEQARAREEEEECRRRAEEELRRCLVSDEPPREEAKRLATRAEEVNLPCDERNTTQVQAGEHH